MKIARTANITEKESAVRESIKDMNLRYQIGGQCEPDASNAQLGDQPVLILPVKPCHYSVRVEHKERTSRTQTLPLGYNKTDSVGLADCDTSKVLEAPQGRRLDFGFDYLHDLNALLTDIRNAAYARVVLGYSDPFWRCKEYPVSRVEICRLGIIR